MKWKGPPFSDYILVWDKSQLKYKQILGTSRHTYTEDPEPKFETIFSKYSWE